MTEREPFALVKTETKPPYFILYVCGNVHAYYDTWEVAHSVAELLNTYFNKRLDEELAKARAEWERGKK